jgi:hypothetical protein
VSYNVNNLFERKKAEENILNSSHRKASGRESSMRNGLPMWWKPFYPFRKLRELVRGGRRRPIFCACRKSKTKKCLPTSRSISAEGSTDIGL